jgi:hypothetical protein
VALYSFYVLLSEEAGANDPLPSLSDCANSDTESRSPLVFIAAATLCGSLHERCDKPLYKPIKAKLYSRKLSMPCQLPNFRGHFFRFDPAFPETGVMMSYLSAFVRCEVEQVIDEE